MVYAAIWVACQMHWQCAFYHASHGARSSSPARGAINSTVCFSVAVTTIVVVIGITIIIVMIIVESVPPYAAIWVALSGSTVSAPAITPPMAPAAAPSAPAAPQQHRLLFRRRCHHRCGHWHRHQYCHCHRRVSLTVRCHLGSIVRYTVSAPFIMPSTAPPTAPLPHYHHWLHHPLPCSLSRQRH